MLSDGRMIDEQWTGKDLEGSVSDLIEVLSRNFAAGTEKYHKILTQNIRFPLRNSIWAPPEYKALAFIDMPVYLALVC
jgi:hypothetical protein